MDNNDLNCGKGIRWQIENTKPNKHYVHNIDSENFVQAIKDLFYATADKINIPIVLHTGRTGLIVFDLSLRGCELNFNVVGHFTDHEKYSNNHLALSLFTKHGNIKAYLKDDKFECYDGTKLILVTKDLNHNSIIKYLKRFHIDTTSTRKGKY